MSKPRVLILHATGTNRDREAAWAIELAGGQAEIVHVNQLMAREARLADFRMLVLPGGFSFGDNLGAGKLWATTLRHGLGEQMEAFVASGRPVLGICNGFQALVKAGLLPGPEFSPKPTVTLTRNDSGRFECRWVYLEPERDSPCIFTRTLRERIYCPVAHGEGKFVARDVAALAVLESRGLVGLRYTHPEKREVSYPWNPNGSHVAIAGVCNPAGNVFGLMPHPEDHIVAAQHPRYHRGEVGLSGLPLFENGVRHAADI